MYAGMDLQNSRAVAISSTLLSHGRGGEHGDQEEGGGEEAHDGRLGKGRWYS